MTPIIVYSANIGNYDNVHHATTLPYHLFFSQNDTILASTATQRNARRIKLLYAQFLPPHEYSVWVDGSISPDFTHIQHLIDTYLKNGEYDIITYTHPDRDCIYQEAEACIELKKDNPEIIRKQIEFIRSQGYPAHNGLIASGLLIRKNTPALQKFCEQWHDMVDKYSVRDQLSFNYVLWKYNQENEPINVKTIPFLEKAYIKDHLCTPTSHTS